MGKATDPFEEAGDYSVDAPIDLPRIEHRQLIAYARDLSGMYRQLREAQRRLEEVYVSTLTTLAAAIEARDPYLVGHSRAVSAHAVSVGQEMGLPPERLRALLRAALLHDIGKLGVPDSVLKKDGPLDGAEWEQMRRHPELGYEILASLSFLGEALPGIRHHHERYDGGGYPAGLAAEDIPIVSRILCVCDAFDAMTSDRPYRSAMPPDRAIDRLLKDRGRQFDPEIVSLLLRSLQGPGRGGADLG